MKWNGLKISITVPAVDYPVPHPEWREYGLQCVSSGAIARGGMSTPQRLEAVHSASGDGNADQCSCAKVMPHALLHTALTQNKYHAVIASSPAPSLHCWLLEQATNHISYNSESR